MNQKNNNLKFDKSDNKNSNYNSLNNQRNVVIKKIMDKYGLSNYEATVLVKDKDISDYFEECLKVSIDAKTASNWVTVNIVGELNKEFLTIKEFYLTPSMLKQITDNILSGTILLLTNTISINLLSTYLFICLTQSDTL